MFMEPRPNDQKLVLCKLENERSSGSRHLPKEHIPSARREFATFGTRIRIEEGTCAVVVRCSLLDPMPVPNKFEVAKQKWSAFRIDMTQYRDVH